MLVFITDVSNSKLAFNKLHITSPTSTSNAFERLSIDMEIENTVKILYMKYKIYLKSSSMILCSHHMTTFKNSNDTYNRLQYLIQTQPKLHLKIDSSRRCTSCYSPKISGHLVDHFSHNAKSSETPRNKAGKRIEKQVKLKFFSTLFNTYQKVKYIHRHEDK